MYNAEFKPEEDDVSTIASSAGDNDTIKTKDELRSSIKELIELDEELKRVQTEKRGLDKRRKALSAQLMRLMREKGIDSFDTAKTRLLYKQSTRRPMGQSTLSSLLQDYYKDDPDAAQQLRTYIFEHLPEKTVESLVLKPKDMR